MAWPISRQRLCASTADSNRCGSDAATCLGEADNCGCTDEIVDPSTCCPTIVPRIGELFIVRDEIVCYEPGEIAYIENIVESQILERTHRRRQSEESYFEDESTQSSFNERDHQTENKSSLNNEVNEVVNSNLGVTAGASFSYKGKATGYSYGINGGLSYNRAREDARRDVTEHATSVIEKAVTRLERNQRSLVTQRFTVKSDDQSRHVFGGMDGAPHDISRQFYYVRQVRRAQVFSHGLRQMVHLHVPEPAALFKEMLKLPKPPKTEPPPEPTLVDCSTISPENYLQLAALVGVAGLDTPPEDETRLQYVTIDHKDLKDSDSRVEQISIDSGFTAIHMAMEEYKPVARNEGVLKSDNTVMDLWFGTGHIYEDRKKKPTSMKHDSSIDATGNSPCTVIFKDFKKVSIRLRLSLLKRADLTEWRQQTCDSLNRAISRRYEELTAQKENADKALIEHAKAQAALVRNKVNGDPFVLSETIREELKRHMIAYITCQYFDANSSIDGHTKPCGFPQLNAKRLSSESRLISFVEQALEWNLMSYRLLDSFWARKCTWIETAQLEGSTNPLFDKFLRAGMAQVTLSVRPGFEERFLHFVRTGRIIDGSSNPAVPGADLIPISQEMREDRQNFNTDREGYVSWDTSQTALKPNQVLLCDNVDYFTGDPKNVSALVFDPDEAKCDLEREFIVDFKTYRIVDIVPSGIGTDCIITLDKPFEGATDREWRWTTGAVHVGSPWEYRVGTNGLVWLREDERCLPCYPINC